MLAHFNHVYHHSSEQLYWESPGTPFLLSPWKQAFAGRMKDEALLCAVFNAYSLSDRGTAEIFLASWKKGLEQQLDNFVPPVSGLSCEKMTLS